MSFSSATRFTLHVSKYCRRASSILERICVEDIALVRGPVKFDHRWVTLRVVGWCQISIAVSGFDTANSFGSVILGALMHQPILHGYVIPWWMSLAARKSTTCPEVTRQ